MDREQRIIKAIAEAIARGECPPRTTPQEWTNFEKQAKAVFYDLVLTVQLHDDDSEPPAKVDGDEREAFESAYHKVFPPRVLLIPSVLSRDGDDYQHPNVDGCWKLWRQARAALSAGGGERETAEQRDDGTVFRRLAKRASLSADGGEAVDLEGLRAKLLDGRPVIRDAEGWYDHPAMPGADEDVNYEWLLAALGIETRFVSMEADDSDAYDRYGAAHEPDCHYWTPTVPEGDGWQLLSVYDTEDGPHALFGRDIYALSQARKKEHTRRIAVAIAANQAKGDAS